MRIPAQLLIVHIQVLFEQNSESTNRIRNPVTFRGIHLQFAESTTQQLCRENLRYTQLYAEFTEVL